MLFLPFKFGILLTVFYHDKIDTLKDLFGTPDVAVEEKTIRVGDTHYPIVNDVIILSTDAPQAEDIQFTFGKEWQTYSAVLPEHRKEFEEYFDLVDIAGLEQARVCDLGCGMGRWSYFLKDRCKELVLVDFSEAIFAARKNLAGADNVLFFRGDLQRLPFKENFADFLFCLGVLHHLPVPCLDEVRRLARSAPRLLIFLYYALDNRPCYFQILLKGVTAVRQGVSRIRHPTFRKLFAWCVTLFVYVPLVGLGWLLRPIGLSRFVPLYEYYHGKSLGRIEQDAYDRFFTRIEQRVTRQEILSLQDTFKSVMVSDHYPYWHFICQH